jgi:hypothetical protein
MYLTKVAILTTYGKLIQKHRKNYVYPSQASILELLSRYHSISISRRTLAYHLADLRVLGYIKSIRRHHRTIEGQIEQLSTAVCLTMSGCRLLWKLGSSFALFHLKKLSSRFAIHFTKAEQPAEPPKPPQKHTPGFLEKTAIEQGLLEKYPALAEYYKKKAIRNRLAEQSKQGEKKQ